MLKLNKLFGGKMSKLQYPVRMCNISGKEKSKTPAFFFIWLFVHWKHMNWYCLVRKLGKPPTPAICLLSVSLKHTVGMFKMNTTFAWSDRWALTAYLFCSADTRLIMGPLLILGISRLRLSPHFKNGTLCFTSRFKVVLLADGLSGSSRHFLVPIGPRGYLLFSSLYWQQNPHRTELNRIYIVFLFEWCVGRRNASFIVQ